MTVSRYSRSPVLSFGKYYGTSAAHTTIRNAIKTGAIRYKTITLGERDRLDIIAGREYNDSTLWWIIAAASNIGWGLQVPPGTYVVIPVLSDVMQFVG